MSHYEPAKGGVNCASFINGECVSRMANGERWQDYWGKNNTIACPKELPFGTEIILDGHSYTCRDRGGAINTLTGNIYWIDILTDNPPYSFGTVVQAYIKR